MCALLVRVAITQRAKTFVSHFLERTLVMEIGNAASDITVQDAAKMIKNKLSKFDKLFRRC